MEVILIGVSIAVLGITAALSVFSLATREAKKQHAVPNEDEFFLNAEKFFFETPLAPAKTFPNQPPKEILARLERHFRSEEQAAASFLDGPVIESLHAPFPSPVFRQGKGR